MIEPRSMHTMWTYALSCIALNSSPFQYEICLKCYMQPSSEAYQPRSHASLSLWLALISLASIMGVTTIWSDQMLSFLFVCIYSYLSLFGDYYLIHAFDHIVLVDHFNELCTAFSLNLAGYLMKPNWKLFCSCILSFLPISEYSLIRAMFIDAVLFWKSVICFSETK